MREGGEDGRLLQQGSGAPVCLVLPCFALPYYNCFITAGPVANVTMAAVKPKFN